MTDTMVAKLLSIRVWIICAIPAAIPAMGVETRWPDLYLPVFWGMFFLILGLYATCPYTSTPTCPACRKSVKMGASACHHCGREV
jgi:hypothetical protein